MPTKTFYIQSGGDDGYFDRSNSFKNSTNSYIKVGRGSWLQICAWLRFIDIDIPKDSVITSATLNWKMRNNASIPTIIKAIKTSNPNPPSNINDLLQNTTDSYTDFSTYYPNLFPDVTPIVQEIVNADFWNINSIIMFSIDGVNTVATATFYSYENSDIVPSLIVNYEEPILPPLNEVSNVVVIKYDEGTLSLSCDSPTDSDFDYTKIYENGEDLGYGFNGNVIFPTDTDIPHTYVLKCVYTSGRESEGVEVTYTPEVESLPPIVTILEVSRSTISDKVSMDISTVTFVCDQDILEWNARAVLDSNTASVGVGLLVGNGGSVSNSTEVTFDIESNELSNGDGTYQINIYVKDLEGVWH